MIVHVYACSTPPGRTQPHTGRLPWWFEIEVEQGESTQDPGPEVIHTDGMYATKDEAISAGKAWAMSQGYTIGPLPEAPR
jgi:hypothetical protein